MSQKFLISEPYLRNFGVLFRHSRHFLSVAPVPTHPHTHTRNILEVIGTETAPQAFVVNFGIFVKICYGLPPQPFWLKVQNSPVAIWAQGVLEGPDHKKSQEAPGRPKWIRMPQEAPGTPGVLRRLQEGQNGYGSPRGFRRHQEGPHGYGDLWLYL